MRIISFLLGLMWIIPTFGQICSPDCKTNYNNYTGDIIVYDYDVVCITGTYSGNITMLGGVVHICAKANISNLNFKKISQFIAEKSAFVNVQNLSGDVPVSLTNYCDSFTVFQGNMNKDFIVTNYRKFCFNNGTVNGGMQITNYDTMIVNTAITVDDSSVVTNYKVITVNAGINNNRYLKLNNYCQLRINGDLILNGQDLSVSGYIRMNNLNINSGTIILNDAAIMYVNSMSVGGYIKGNGQRSTLRCEQNPNLNSQNAIRGQIALCVGNGTYVPNPGTVGDGAILSCDNAIGPSECNPEGFGYDLYRMTPTVSNKWNDTATWETYKSNGTWVPATGGRYPGKGSAVIIGDGKTMTISTPVQVRKLTLGTTSGAQLKTDSASGVFLLVTDTLELKGSSLVTLSNNAYTFKGRMLGTLNLRGTRDSKLEFSLKNGNYTLNMDNTSPGTRVLGELTYNLSGGTLTLADTLKIAKALRPNGGILATGGKLVLLSDPDNTASVLGGSGTYLTGKITVQRYIQSIARRFRFLSAPVNNNSLLDWQQETFITGNNAAGTATGTTVGQFNSAGFDATTTNNPSMYTYDETILDNLDIGWVAVTNETSTLADVHLPVGRGYRLYIRGDRSDYGRLDGTNNYQNAITLDMKGDLNMGDIALPVTYSNSGNLDDDGWCFVGNPYPSAYDWKSFYQSGQGSTTNLDPIVWIFDPRSNSYISYNALSQAGTLADGIIPSGASFWVKTHGTNPSLKITEAFKVAETKSLFLNSNNPRDFEEYDQLDLRLVMDSVNSDRTIIKYVNGALKTKDELDIVKIWGGDVGITTFSSQDSVFLDLSCRPMDYSDADFINVYFYANFSGNYKLEMHMTPQKEYLGARAYLLDKLTNKYISIQPDAVYDFSVDLNDPTTYGYNRFFIVYFPASPPESWITFLFAEKENNNIHVRWGTNIEPFPTTFEVQRGYVLSNMLGIGTIEGRGNSTIGSNYDMIDSTVNLALPVYYRIAYHDTINLFKYSTAILVDYTSVSEIVPFQKQLTVYPNPVKEVLNIKYTDKAYHGSLQVSITDITGKEKLKRTLGDPSPGGALQIYLDNLEKGLYFIEITNVSNQKAVFKIMKN